jgi:hypothetical protein
VTDLNLESASPDLESAVPALETLLVEMIAMVLGEEAVLSTDSLPAVPLAVSRLIIHDSAEEFYLGVEMRAEGTLATMLTSSLLAVEDPAPDDVLDVIAELGNIAAGNVKTLLCTNARLSLPASVLAPPPLHDPAGGVRAVATLLGHVIELVVMPVSGADAGTRWPPGFDQI